jgi:hypothetical protein
MELLRTRIRDTITAKARVWGDMTEKIMDLPMAHGFIPKNTPMQTAPRKKAWPRDRFFRTQTITMEKTMNRRIKAGI